MELDFDKEIDALLRKARRDGPVYVGDIASPHLDADELSAFGENAMPEKSRTLHMAHLADCDRCRKILSNLLVMNAEAAPAAASPSVGTTAVSTGQPWYRQLFLFPNLAYVMGSLVLIFGGFFAFSVIQDSSMGSEPMSSQQPASETTRGGPNFQEEPLLAEDANHAPNTSANVAATGIPSAAANTNAAISAESSPRNVGARENNFVLDGDSAADVTAAAPPPVAVESRPAVKDDQERDDLAKLKTENKAVSPRTIQELPKNAPMPKQFPDTSSQSGPMRNNESQYNRQLENMDAARAKDKKRSLREEEAPTGGRKVVGGRTFERKQGVWYDTSYQSRPTINIRRGSAEFSKLDGGLRSIANSLSGTIVVVWGAKAYRIQ